MKRTKKFVAAEKIARQIGINIDTDIYKNLEAANYFWDKNLEEWVESAASKAPIKFIEIRIKSDGTKIKKDYQKIVYRLLQDFYVRSETDCRSCLHPDQSNSIIYLELERKE